jgi:PAS domain S-box-containing protein
MLEEMSSNLLEILDLGQEGILLLNDREEVLFANKVLGQFFQTTEKTMVGRNFSEYLDTEEAALLHSLHKATVEEPGDRMQTACIDRRDRGQRIEVLYGRPKGKNKPTFYYFRDITKRANAEQKLIERNSFLNGLIESSVDGIIAADMTGKIILFNKGAQNLLGYTEAEARNEVHTTRLYTEGTAHEILRRMRSDEYGGPGKCIKHRVIGLSNEGDEVPISLSGGIIYSGDAKEVASFGIFTDLRQVEQMQKRLNDKQMQLIQSEKMASLGRLAAGVAHEINNPLSGVLIFANLVLEDLPEDSDQRQDLERVISETTRCKTIVRELLDFARQDDTTCEMLDINHVIKESIHLVRNQSVFLNVEIVLDLEPNLPVVSVSTTRLNQVFLNLYLNAAEAMDGAGTLTVRTSAIADGKSVQVEFCDTGHGIPMDIQTNIFEPFFTTKEVGKGTGLGLSVSYGIIQDCGGTINVWSEQGKGATFVVALPTMEAQSQGQTSAEKS